MELEGDSEAFQRCSRRSQRVSWASHEISGSFRGVPGMFQKVLEGFRSVSVFLKGLKGNCRAVPEASGGTY